MSAYFAQLSPWQVYISTYERSTSNKMLDKH